ncbi:MAG: hypothetical protein HOB84_15455 [Candidatus Marinimicrobia bacterium]|jgi:hypothetical protein|nr:hypothetical protein [Candidatus Neomarinimicrobiota bacterium]MBT4362255.1 hypothetical protein [Candidatus Neomarinimicrobiota bacterium]MBT4716166.1 hypothetical protein [Candidatus Neomarinimicrobiota bacterium]MBT4947646.1 hypothetical protein [Candidatus Neomarinimicrobiota bacterium]MBT5271197.1 hypothetical protein [Candidatus Neomarinimicrobiota bacterium]
MKKLISAIIIMALIPLATYAQFNISGDLTPSGMLRISDASLIDLPFRLGNISLDYAYGDFELKTVTALETRWKDPEIDEDMFKLREAYLLWYPAFGEVKLGKMIHAWGAADANNPTDNLSPYDYYYMFLAGTDRKLGSMSLAVKTYVSDFQIEVVALPEFEANRFPLNEPDFPISIPIPEGAQYFYPENEFEFGGRVQYAMGIGDLSASYFKGHDRSFSPAGLEIDLTALMSGGSPFTSHLTYRETDVIGLDAVLFPGNWTLRGEFGYFRTQTPDIEYAMSKFTYDADYLQSVIQVEYAFANTVQLMGQLISNKTQGVESTMEKDDYFQSLEFMLQDTSNHMLDPLRVPFSQMGLPEFSAGMGTPFALIADQVVILSSMVTLLDNSLDLNGMFMINLEETGYMANIGSTYSIVEGLNLETTLSYFIGGDEEGNRFKQLEDFSNVNLGLSYSF